jgi:hypothetical protein
VPECVTIWTVYQHPCDYPGWWVLRGYDVIPGALQPHEAFFTAQTLEEIRGKVPPASLCIGRQPDDHPAIYECWVAYTDFHVIANLIDRRPALPPRRRLDPTRPARVLREQERRDRIPEINLKKPTLVPPSGLSTDAELTPREKGVSLRLTARETVHLEVWLVRVTQHVKEGDARIGRVRATIERRRESGLTSELTENLLNTMLESLSLLNDTKARIEGSLASVGANKRV